MRISARNQGFTLIELMIVVSLVTILTGAMIPRFTGYLDTQNLKQAQEQVKSDLRSAAVRALSGVGASNTDLAYWGINFIDDNDTYTTLACNASCTTTFLSQVSEKLPGDIKIRNSTRILFSTKNGDASSVSSLIVTLGPQDAAVGTNKCAQVIVNSAGMVKKGSTTATCL